LRPAKPRIDEQVALRVLHQGSGHRKVTPLELGPSAFISIAEKNREIFSGIRSATWNTFRY